jgi:hypothetical protein
MIFTDFPNSVAADGVFGIIREILLKAAALLWKIVDSTKEGACPNASFRVSIKGIDGIV